MNETLIPKGWESFELECVADVIDPHPSHRAPPRFSNGFPFAGIGDIDENGVIDIDNCRKIAEKFVTQQEKSYELNKNSIGYGRVGTVGKVFKLRKQKFRYALSPTLAVINPKEKINSDFLLYELKSPFFYHQVLQNSSGATRPALGITKLRKLLILVPQLETQKKIVEKLDYIFEHLEEKKKQILHRMGKFDSEKIHKTYQNHLLKLAFSGVLTDDKLIDTEKDKIQIPKGWKIIKLSNTEYFFNVMGGGTPSRTNSSYYGGVIPWVRLADVKTKYINETNETLTDLGLKKLGNKLIPKNAVILSTRATIGKVAIAGRNLCTNQGFKSTICNLEKVVPEYLYYFFKFIRKLLLASSKSATYAEINKSRLLNIEILIPSLETQKKIVEILDTKFEEWTKYKTSIENIEKQYQHTKKSIENLSNSILNSAFSGKLVN